MTQDLISFILCLANFPETLHRAFFINSELLVSNILAHLLKSEVIVFFSLQVVLMGLFHAQTFCGEANFIENLFLWGRREMEACSSRIPSNKQYSRAIWGKV
jgi:hypothetical protein